MKTPERDKPLFGIQLFIVARIRKAGEIPARNQTPRHHTLPSRPQPMNPMLSHNGIRRLGQRGGVSVGAVLLVAVIVLLLALLGLGYAWFQTNSQNAALRQETNDLYVASIREAATATNAAIAAAEAARKERLAVAKARRDDFTVRAKGVTNQIHTILDRAVTLQKALDDLRTGPTGQKAAAHPELVTTARGLFSKDVRKLPEEFEANQRLESARRLMFTVADNENTEYAPSNEINVTLEDIRKWADLAANEQGEVSASIKYLQNEGQIRTLPAGALTSRTLQAAMDAQVALASADIHRNTTTIKDKATSDGAITQAQADADRIRAQADLEAERARIKIEAAKQAEKEAALVREAGTAEVRQILAVIASPGIMEANGRPKASGKPGPMSYNALVSEGCILPGTPGMKNLYGVASHPADRERPRWERKYGGVFMNYPERREVVAQAHDTLIRLGPYLVKAGVLEP